MEIQFNLKKLLSEFSSSQLPSFVVFLEEKICFAVKEQDFTLNYLIRWGVTAFNSQTYDLKIEAQCMTFDPNEPAIGRVRGINALDKRMLKIDRSSGSIGVFVVPTGLGCSIGGFAGDANMAANLVADELDWLVVNPNVVNAGAWQNLSNNMLYVEGFALDLFMKGLIGLRPRLAAPGLKASINPNKIGVIIDAGISKELVERKLQVIEAAKLIWGLDISQIVFTSQPLDLRLEISNSSSSGVSANPNILIDAAKHLKQQGVEAIAVLCSFDEASRLINEQHEKNYQQGLGADPIGGLEAVISHIVCMATGLPSAHAPVFTPEVDIKMSIDSRVSPEIASYSFLPSVLKGLSLAPSLVPVSQLLVGDLTVNKVSSFIGPADCWGGSSFLSALECDWMQKYAVASNKTQIGLMPIFFSNLDKESGESVLSVSNYLELIGRLKAIKLGYKINKKFF